VKSKPKTFCDGVNLPEVGAVLVDPQGITWRVHHRRPAFRRETVGLYTTQRLRDCVQLRPTGGHDLKLVVSAEDVSGWEVL
jgi:hypothetical protein